MRPNPSLNTLQNISSSDDDYSPDKESNWKKYIENAFNQNDEIKRETTVNEAVKKKRIEQLKHAMYKNYHQQEGLYFSPR